MLGRPEVLGEPALGGEARVLDLAVAVEQHDGGARRRIARERADEAPARLRCPQRVLEAGAHEIEDVTVALGELKTRSGRARRRPPHDAPRGRRSRSRTRRRIGGAGRRTARCGTGGGARRPRRGAAQDADGRYVQAGADDHRVAHDRLEGAGRLDLEGNRRVADGAGSKIDAIPRQHVCRNELGESPQRPAAQLGHRPGATSAGEPVHGTYFCVGEPGHRKATREDTPAGRPRRYLRRPLGLKSGESESVRLARVPV